MLIALIQDNLVKGITAVGSDEEYFAVTHGYQAGHDITDANPSPQVGWVFDGQKLNPPDGQSATPTRKISRLAMRQRFTFPELIAIQTAAKANVAIEVLVNNLSVATYIDLNRADTAGGLYLLASAGVITLARANEIINNPIQDYEKYRGIE